MTLRGFSADHSPDAFGFWLRDLKTWKRDGRIHLTSTTFKGIESSISALQEACAGRLKGVGPDRAIKRTSSSGIAVWMTYPPFLSLIG